MIRTVVFMIIYEIRVYTRYFRVRFMIASKMFHERGAIFFTANVFKLYSICHNSCHYLLPLRSTNTILYQDGKHLIVPLLWHYLC